MPKKKVRVNDFIEQVKANEALRKGTMDLYSLDFKEREKALELDLSTYYEIALENIRKIREYNIRSPQAFLKNEDSGLDSLQEEAFNFFSLFFKRKAPENHLKEFSKICLEAQGLSAQKNRSLNNILFARNSDNLYYLQRKNINDHMPLQLAKGSKYLFEFYRNNKRIISFQEEQLELIKQLPEDEMVLLRRLLKEMNGLEKFPILDPVKEAPENEKKELQGLELSLENISIAIQSTIKYKKERETLKKFYKVKERDPGFYEVTCQRIYRTDGTKKVGYEIYSDFPQFNKVISEPGSFYSWNLFKYADISLIGAKLATTVAVPYFAGFEEEILAGFTLMDYLQAEGLVIKDWEKVVEEPETVAVKTMPDPSNSEIDLVKEIFE
jgi:hypothetical protein